MFIIAVSIFVIALITIALEVFDKSIIAMAGASMMILFGIINPQQALQAIDFEVIILLIAMMILMNVVSKSGLFAWLNVRIATFTKGNPLLIFLLFASITGLISSFLANVTTIMLMVPVTVALVKGAGKDPKPYVIGVIMFCNLGGAISLIGDPTNILIGSASKLSFNDFILNLSLPVLISTILITLIILKIDWQAFKPVNKDISKLFLSNMLVERVKYLYNKQTISTSFVIKSVSVIIITLIAFIFEAYIPIPLAFIALISALLLLFLTKKNVHVENIFKEVEWTTIFFFVGLFVMVAGLESVGLLQLIAEKIIAITNNPKYLILLILWASGIVSMFVDNIPFVTIMIPVIIAIQKTLSPEIDHNLFWWALSLGACLGGFGSLLGSSANIVAVDIAKKEGVNIGFLEYMKIAGPLAILSLTIASVYLIFRI